jgi:hypothetical protein
MQTIRWNGENLAEVQRLLQAHTVHASKHGDILCIIDEGLGITLNLGDELLLNGDQLGVRRLEVKLPDPEIIWDGNNVFEMSRFLSGWGVRCELRGTTLYIHDMSGREKPACLNPGDKIIDRNGTHVVSKAGRDHRIQ